MESDPPGERPPGALGSTRSTEHYSGHTPSPPGATLMARPSAQPAFYTGIGPELSLDDEEVLVHFARAVAVSSLSSLIRSSHGERRGSGARSDVSPVSYGLETGWLAAEFLGSTLETSWLARNRSF